MLRALWAMDILVQNHSSYPRTGDLPAQQHLQQALAAHGRGEIDDAALATAERAYVDEIVHEQVAAGVDIVTDGQVRWADPVSHLMGALDGVELGSLTRFLDTDTYFRQPVVTGSLRRRRPLVLDDFTRAQLASPRPVKPVLTGPYTLARLSACETGAYGGVAHLARALAVVLAEEVEALAAAGATVIQLDEPAILWHPGDIRLLREVWEPLWAARGGAALVLATYFADAEPLYAQLNSVPADILLLDFASGPGLLDCIAATGASKEIAAGLVDGRSTRAEDAAAVAAQAERLTRRYLLDRLHLAPSCGLDLLPRAHARAKLQVLAAARARLRGDG